MKKPLDDIEVFVKNDANLNLISAFLIGPESTPFEHGKFEIELHFDGDYPRKPPKGYFVTKIFHPNVAPSNGEICVNTLKRDWKPSYGIKHILIAIRSLLICPNYDSALNEEAGKLLLTSYDSYVQRAKLFTKIHSIPIKQDTQWNMNENDEEQKKNNKNGGDKENFGMKAGVEQKKETCGGADEYLNENKNNANNNKYDDGKKRKKSSKSKHGRHKKSKHKKSKISASMRRL